MWEGHIPHKKAPASFPRINLIENRLKQSLKTLNDNDLERQSSEWTLICRRSITFFITAFLVSIGTLNAYANPQGANAPGNDATFDNTSTPNTLVVNTSSNNTIINWNSFGIAANETTTFNQPSAGSTVLNRVAGVDPSEIYGTLSSNGKLFLVNPNGIIFGKGSKVNAPAVLASTLDITDDDFLKGNYNFFKNGGSSYIINQGKIAASPGGYVALLSQAVNNQGVIIAPLGSVALAAGEKMTLALDSQSKISVGIDDAVQTEVLGPDGKPMKSGVENSGTIRANGGKVLLTAKVMNDVLDYAVNNSGVVKAGSIQEHDGIVELTASGAPVINKGKIKASRVNIKVSSSKLINKGTIKADHLNISVSDGNLINKGTIKAKKAKISVSGGKLINKGMIKAKQAKIKVSGSLINTGKIKAQQVKINVTGPKIVNTGTINAGQINITAPASKLINKGQIISKSTASKPASGEMSILVSNLQQDGLISADKTINIKADNVSTTIPFQNTLPSAVIKANQVNITANNLGAYGLPIAIDASNIDFNRISGDIDITGSKPIGSNVMITGPPDGFGSIIYNTGTNLTLQASSGSIDINEATSLTANNLTLESQKGINSTGSLIAADAMTLTSAGDIYSLGLLEASSLLERGNSFKVEGIFDPGHADVKNADNAIEYTGSTSISSATVIDPGDIIVDPGVTLTLTQNTVFDAGESFEMDPTSVIDGQTHDLTIMASKPSFLGVISNVGTLTLEESVTDSNPSFLFNIPISVTNFTLHSGTVTLNDANVTNESSSPSVVAVLTVAGTYTQDGGTFNETVEYNDSGNNTLFDISKSVTLTGSTAIFRGPDGSGGNAATTITPATRLDGANALESVCSHLTKNYVQTVKYLDLSGVSNFDAYMIGSISTPFSGTFNGNGYMITTLSINDTTLQNNVGLFGYTSSTAVIENATLLSASVTADSTTNPNRSVGALVGENQGKIINSFAEGTVTGNPTTGYPSPGNFNQYTTNQDYAGFTGGLVGSNEGTITNSSADVDVTGGGFVGGLVGVNGNYDNGAHPGHISNSYAQGTVDGGTITYKKSSCQSNCDYSSYTGGLAGADENDVSAGTTINYSYATGDVNADGNLGGGSVGGLVGNLNSATIEYSYATGNVTNYNNDVTSSTNLGGSTGGLVGSSSGTIKYSYAGTLTSTVTSLGDVGGLVGDMNGGTIKYSYAIESVTNTATKGDWLVNQGSSAGGLVGDSDVGYYGSDLTYSKIAFSYATGNVTVGYGGNAGGLVGNNESSTIDSSYATGFVSASGTESCAGGLAGSNGASLSHSPGVLGEISNSYATGAVEQNNVDSTDMSFAGGLVGENDGNIYDSYSTGTVSNGYLAGGSTPSGSTYIAAGGLVGGTAFQTNSTIIDSFSTSAVITPGGIMAGGLVGFNTFGPSTIGQLAGGSLSATSTIQNGAWYKNSSGTSATKAIGSNAGGAATDLSGSGTTLEGTNEIDLSWFYNTSSGKPTAAVYDQSNSWSHEWTFSVPTGTIGSSGWSLSSIAVANGLYNGYYPILNGAVPYLVSTLPASIPAGTPLSGTITAQYNAYGDTDTGYTRTAQLTSNDPLAYFPSSGLISFTAGVYSITSSGAFLLTQGAGETITATDTTYPGVTGTFTLTVGTPTQASVYKEVVTGTSGQLTLTFYDSNDDVLSNLTQTSQANIPGSSGYTKLNIDVTSSNTALLGGAITLAPGGKLTVQQGALNPDGYSITCSGGTLEIDSAGILLVKTASFGGNYASFSTFTPQTGSTVKYDGAGQTVSNGLSYYNLKISGSGTTTLGGSSTSATNLTIDSSSTLDPVNSTNTITGSGTLDVSGTLLVRASAFSSNYSFGTNTLESSSTVNYDGTIPQTITSTLSPYANLSTSGSGTKTIDNDITVQDDLNVGSSTDVSGAHTLTVDGNAILNGTIGSNTPLLGLSVGVATTMDGGTVKTNGNQTYTGGVTLGTGTTLTATSGNTIDFKSTITGGGNSLQIGSGSDTSIATFEGVVSGLTTLHDYGATNINASSMTSTVSQTYAGAVTLDTGTILKTGNGNTIDFKSTITGGGNSLQIGSGSDTSIATYEGAVSGLSTLYDYGATNINASSMTSTVSQTYTGAVTLDTGTILTTGNGNTIDFKSTITGGGNSLQIGSGSDTSIATYEATVSGLTSLYDYGATNINASSMTSTVSQTYKGAVTLDTGTILTTGNGNTIDFKSTITGGGNSLQIGSGSDTSIATYEGVVSGLTTLHDYGATNINASSMTSTVSQTYAGAVTLDTGTILTTGNGNTIDFKSTITGGGNSLQIGSGSDTSVATYEGGVSGLNTLYDYGATNINASSIASAGNQTYTGAVTLDTGTILTAGNGDTIDFKSTITGGGNSLQIGSGSDTSIATYEGLVSGLTTLYDYGATNINASSMTSTVSQTYKGAVTLDTGTILKTGNGNTIDFKSTITGGGNSLQIGSGSDTSIATYEGVVSGLTTLHDYGATNINASSITSTVSQTYAGAVTLDTGTILTTGNGNTIDFKSTITGGGNSLQIGSGSDTSIATYEGLVSGLTTLYDYGATNINTGSITSTVSQTYKGALTLDIGTILTTGNGNTIDFKSTITGGGNSLQIGSGSDTSIATFEGGVSGLNTLYDYGATNINTTSIASTGNQTYAGDVTLGVSSAVSGNNIIIGPSATFNPAGYTVTGTGTMVLHGTLKVDAINFSDNYGGSFSSPDIETGSTVEYIGNDSTPVNVYPFEYENLTLDGGTSGTYEYDFLTGPTIVDSTLTINGSYGHNILLRGTSGGVWALNIPNGNQTLTYVDVANSTLNPPGNSITALGSVDSFGNSANWHIIKVDVWIGGNSGNIWGDGTNWSTGVKPGANTMVIFDGNEPSVTSTSNTDASYSIYSLSTLNGYTGTIKLFNTLYLTADLQLNSAATLNANTEDIHLGGNWSNTAGTFTSGGNTVYFTGPGTIKSSSSITNNHFGYLYLDPGPGNNITISDDLYVDNDLTVNSGNLKGAHNLKVTGNAAIDGTIGVGSPLTSLSIGGTTTINTASIATAGNQTYTSGVTLSTGTTLTAGNGNTIDFKSTITGGGNSLQIGSGSDTSIATYEGLVSGLTSLYDYGATNINASSMTSTVSQTYKGAVTLDTGTVLKTGNGNTIDFKSTITGGGNSLQIGSGSDTSIATYEGAVSGLSTLYDYGATNINTGSITSTVSQTYKGAVTLDTGTILTTGNGNTIDFKSTITGGGNSLQIGSGSDTSIATFEDAVSGLSTLYDYGATNINASSITSTVSQTYKGAVTLDTGTILKTGNGNTIDFKSTIGADGGGPYSLQIGSGSDTSIATYEGGVSGVSTLYDYGATNIDTASIASSSNQTYEGAVTLDIGTNLTANGNTIDFKSTITGGGNSLQIGSGSDTSIATYEAAVSGLTSLYDYGATNINTGSITSTVSQTYKGAVTLDTGTILTTGNGNTIDFKSTITGGGNSLQIGSGSDTSIATYEGAVSGLTSLYDYGATNINASSIASTVSQTYKGAVTLDTGTILTTGNGNTIDFKSTITGGGNSLQIGSGSDTSIATYEATVSGLTSLYDYGATNINTGSITSTVSQTYKGAVTLDTGTILTTGNGNTINFKSTIGANGGGPYSLQIGSGSDTSIAMYEGGVSGLSTLYDYGPTTINTASIASNGNQTYKGAVTLETGTALTAIGNTVDFKSTIGNNGSDESLTIGSGGDASIAMFEGGVSGLSTLYDYGPTTINTSSIASNGNQTYKGAVTLETGTALTATGNTVDFKSTIGNNGSDESLTIGSGGDASIAMFEGGVSGLSTLYDYGPTTINTSSIASNGNQTYKGAVTLETGTALTATGNTVDFKSTIGNNGSDESLTIGSGGDASIATFEGGVSGVSTLYDYGATNINASSITSTVSQTYKGAVTLDTGTILTTGNGNTIDFKSTITGGGNSLQIGSGSDTSIATYEGVVSGLTSLYDYGATNINTGSITSTVSQTYKGAVTLDTGTILKTGNGNTIDFKSTITGGGNSLQIGSGSDTSIATYEGAVNGLTTLYDYGATNIDTGSIASTVSQTYKGAVTLDTGTILTTGNGNTIDFKSTITGGGNSLQIGSGSDTSIATYEGGESGLTTLHDYGATNINTSSITSTVSQTYEGAVTLDTGTILTTGNGNTIDFKSTITGGGNSLQIGSGSDTSIATYEGGVSGLTTLYDYGTTNINASSITSTVSQTYKGAVTLDTGTILTAGNGNTIDFKSTITGGGNSLQIGSGSDTSIATYEGAVSGLTSLYDYGATNINASSIASTVSQTYKGAVTLDTGTILTTGNGNTIDFKSTITGGGNSLQIGSGSDTSTATFEGVVSGLSTLYDYGATNINTTSITTATTQEYDGDVTLGVATAALSGSIITIGPSATFNPAGNAVNGTGTLDVEGTLKVDATSFGGNYAGSFSSPAMQPGSTVNYSGTSQTIESSFDYYNLVISGSGTDKLNGYTTLINDLTIGSSTTLDLYVGSVGYTLYVGNSMTNNGTVNGGITGVASYGKVYDGTTAAATSTFNFQDAELVGKLKVGGQTGTVGYTNVTGTFASKDTGPEVVTSMTGFNFGGITVSGTGTFAIIPLSTITGNITGRPLTVTATGDNKIFNGSSTATVTLSDNRIPGDNLTDSYISATFTNDSVGSNQPILVTGISISGPDAGFYTLQDTTATAFANIYSNIMGSQIISGFPPIPGTGSFGQKFFNIFTPAPGPGTYFPRHLSDIDLSAFDSLEDELNSENLELIDDEFNIIAPSALPQPEVTPNLPPPDVTPLGPDNFVPPPPLL